MLIEIIIRRPWICVSVEIKLIESCPCKNKEELNARERQHMRAIGTLNQVVPGAYAEAGSRADYIKEWRTANRERRAECDRAWQQANRDRINERQRAYRARAKAAKNPPSQAPSEIPNVSESPTLTLLQEQ